MRNRSSETQSDTAAEYQQSRQAIVVALLALVLIGLVAALVVARSITRPLELLRDRIDALADGRLGLEVPYQQQANELGDIARAVEVFKRSMVGLERERWLKAHGRDRGASATDPTTRALSAASPGAPVLAERRERGVRCSTGSRRPSHSRAYTVAPMATTRAERFAWAKASSGSVR